MLKITKVFVISVTLFIFTIQGMAAEINNGVQKNLVQNIQQGISIRHFTINRKVIPIYYKYGKMLVSSIKLPDMVITNNGDKIQKLEKIEIVAKTDNNELVRYKLPGNEGSKVSAKINQYIIILKKTNELDRLKQLFGDMNIPKNGFSNSTRINPQDSYLIPLSRLLFVHYIGKKRINKIQIILTFESDSGEKRIMFPVVLTQYKTKGKYICPLQGSINIVSLPTNFNQHRASTYQEFAIDIWDIRFNRNLNQYETHKPNPQKLSDYYIYHRDVLAPEDGEVVEIGDEFPEELMNNPENFSAQYFEKLRNELVPKIGYNNFVAGNYIIIDHKNGEYSFYGHLSEGTIKVKAGDKVKQGDIIAKVGNTGHSDAPHLHFHIMDSPNWREANGLPITFKNIPISTMGFDVIESNSLIHSDFLYLYIPKKKR